jgi:hypothetical protein
MTIFGNCSVMKPKLYFAGLIKDIAVGRMEEWKNGLLEECIPDPDSYRDYWGEC